MRRRYSIAMPANFIDDDGKWIEQKLSSLNPEHRTSARQGYDMVFCEARDNEPVSYKKDNAARRAANIRLRVYTDKMLEKYHQQSQSQGNFQGW